MQDTKTHVLQLLLEQLHHVLLDYQPLLVEVFDDEIVVFAVEMDNDGLDRRLALDEDTLDGENGQLGIYYWSFT